MFFTISWTILSFCWTFSLFSTTHIFVLKLEIRKKNTLCSPWIQGRVDQGDKARGTRRVLTGMFKGLCLKRMGVIASQGRHPMVELSKVEKLHRRCLMSLVDGGQWRKNARCEKVTDLCKSVRWPPRKCSWLLKAWREEKVVEKWEKG